MISAKQKKIMAFPYSNYDAIICDGAVRSGKTSIMILTLVDWAMREFNGQRFGICGKTVDSAVKNIIIPYISMSYAKKRYVLRWRRTDKILEVTCGNVKNYFEVFGGRDESSFALIQGRTLAGVLLDEVALMPRSFVEQALTRCSVEGAKLWFSCNPESPMHWFYVEWIKRHKERNALYLHFEMTDNPGLSEKTLERYQNMFVGVFYDRYVRGLWVVAEGLIYPMYDNTVETIERDYTKYYISMDYGTLNPTAMILWGLCDGVWYAVKEYYHSGRETNQQKTDEQYYKELERLAGNLEIKNVIIDPSAASFITLVEQKHKFKVWKAHNEVLDGIRNTALCLQQKRIMFNDVCKHAIAEFGLYSWDDKATEDRPIKQSDHCLTGETKVETIDGAKRIDELVGKSGKLYCADGESVKQGYFHDVRMTQKEADIFEIALTNGKKVKATAEHPFLTKRGWVKLSDLCTDDEIACIGGFENENNLQRGQEERLL